MDLGRPRVDLGHFPTPLHHDEPVGSRLGVDELVVKRDDLTGFGWGGNKVRAVEYLIGDACEIGATDVVIASGPTSNFAAAIAAGARRHRLRVEQFAYGTEPAVPPLATRVGRAQGAVVRFTGSDDRASMDRMAADRARELERQGATPYLLPRGGASAVGALGFVSAAVELHGQLLTAGLDPAHIVLPVGSGGSITGLLVGQALLGVRWPVVGVAVSRPIDETTDAVRRLAGVCASQLGLDPDAVPDATIVDGRGAGFGRSSPAEAKLACAIEGEGWLPVDPVYNAKALRWLAESDLRGLVVYWNTGGLLGAIQQLMTETT